MIFILSCIKKYNKELLHYILVNMEQEQENERYFGSSNYTFIRVHKEIRKFIRLNRVGRESVDETLQRLLGFESHRSYLVKKTTS